MTIDEAFVPLDDAHANTATWTLSTAPLRLVEIGAAGALIAVFLILVWLGLRPDLAQAPWTAFFWVKASYTAGLALVGLQAVSSLLRPRGGAPIALAAGGVLVSAMLIAAAIEVGQAPFAELVRALRPTGACLFNVVSLAAPMLLFATLGLRRLDLERPAAVGFAAGLFSGGVAATVHGLHCPYSSFAFVALAYTQALAACGAIGAAALVLARRRGPSATE